MNTADTSSRNWRAYMVTPEALAMALTTGQAWFVKDGIPEGARVVGFNTDLVNGVFRLFIEHHSFESVHQAEMLPEHNVECKALLTKTRWEKLYEHNKDARPGELFVLTQDEPRKVRQH